MDDKQDSSSWNEIFQYSLMKVFAEDELIDAVEWTMWRLVLVGTFDFVPFVIGAFLFGLTFAMFYNGAVDPRLAIRRGAAIGFLGIVLSTLFVAFESLIQSQVVLHMPRAR